jgi:hypothetical protein
VNQLPSDFSKVLEVYKMFGDVMKIDEGTWIDRYPKRFFDPSVVDKSIKHFGVVYKSNSDMDVKVMNESLKKFVDQVRGTDESTIHHVISINMRFGITRLLKDFKQLAERLLVEDHSESKSQILQPDKAVFSKQRIHHSKIEKGIELLELKIAEPFLNNWRLGLLVNYSQSFTNRLSDTRESEDRVRETKKDLGKVISRALLRFERMAEHAARGRFPCDDPIEYEPFDYDQIRNRLIRYSKWLERIS